MEAFRIGDLSFTYPGAAGPVLHRISLTVEQGAFLVLCGLSGCGKTTLLRQLKPSLSPRGSRAGEILWMDRPLEKLSRREESGDIGFVGQSPADQMVTDKVWHELAFGLENLGVDTEEIRRRVAEMAGFFGIDSWFHRDTAQLSGGQKQLLALAAVMVMRPKALVLDEPTAQLDPIAAEEFLSMLGRINRELGTTVILSEHRLGSALPMADAAAVLDRGQLLAFGTPRQVGEQLKKLGHPMFCAMPAPMQVWAAVETEEVCPLTVREGRGWLSRFCSDRTLTPLPPEEEHLHGETPTLSARRLWFRYEKDGPDVVRGLSLEVYPGEFLALLGSNGGGKTTALHLLAGLAAPQRGGVERTARTALLPQDPRTLFLKQTVEEELLETAADEAALSHVVTLCRLEGLLERHPYDLSGGEQQRCALAKLLLTGAQILLLDEPTKGLDAAFQQELAQILQQLLRQGTAVVMVSHDMDFCAQYAHRCALFFDGEVTAQGTPRAFFGNNSFYTTAACRMAREAIPGAVTAREVIACCGGALPAVPRREEPCRTDEPDLRPDSWEEPGPEREKLPLKKRLSALSVLLLAPLTLLLGSRWDGGHYYLLSTALLLECMLPFFMRFEGRRPGARELVVIASLCALGVAGRAALFMAPQAKPVLALTIVAGAALGGESGFLVGAMTMLTSNLMFGQGPWTPWQMFGMGIIGFLSGVLFAPGRLPREREPLCAFGAVSAVVIYGGLLNASSAILAGESINGRILLAYWLSGFPLDCVHAGATVAFLWVGARPMLEKLERIRVKYGWNG